ncbi:hypothetical protein HYALB_00000954 [Hymenoscyphus albidus]|uniref:Heterokaryon incompatibility domain-containing protein n=1 Tax=Hymenoscyphus albidus TaxID=595503 RepID=A0A9N9M1V2_9HELO|nr:hypothetical protein HYALB_00000954 [Hymenoscyphus albidus]
MNIDSLATSGGRPADESLLNVDNKSSTSQEMPSSAVHPEHARESEEMFSESDGEDHSEAKYARPNKWKFDPRHLDLIANIIAPEVAELEQQIHISSSGECQFCQKVLDEWVSRVEVDLEYDERGWIEFEIQHRNILLSCKAAAIKGCRMCQLLLWDKFYCYDKIPCSGLDLHETCIFSSLARRPLLLEFGSRDDDQHDLPVSQRGWHICLTYDPFESDYWADIKLPTGFQLQFRGPVLWENNHALPTSSPFHLSLNETSENQRQDSLIQLARIWLSQCTEEHQICRNVELAQQTSFPSRLLALKNDRIRLCETNTLDEPTHYATLSHCWGHIKFLTLTKENLQEFQKEIPLTQLCKTFQQAIYIAKGLDIDYLWIDSLCIIQNDQNNWEEESPKMCDIYSNSSLTIAAAGAENGTEGCFSGQPYYLRSHQFRRKIHGTVKKFECSYDELYSDCVSGTPLAKRGWVLQERLLSPRTLYFGGHQMYWECNDRDACETIPEGFSNKMRARLGVNTLPNGVPLHEEWSEIVHIYSQCDLSFQKDKLVAISGIAERIFKATHDEYYAGLWKENFANQLAWHVQRTNHPRPLVYRAPSWSWASVDGVIDDVRDPHWQFICRPHIQVLEVSTTPKGLSRFGEISAGYLRLKCDILMYLNINEGNMKEHIVIPKLNTSLFKIWDYRDLAFGTFYVLPVLDGSHSGYLGYGTPHCIILKRIAKGSYVF